MITPELVKSVISDPSFYHAPVTKMVSIENTTNKGGGACYDMDNLKAIKEVCVQNNLIYHLDGARLWNALVAKNHSPKEYGRLFDTISVCLSKGLGAPVGSVLLGTKVHIDRAIRVRKLFGGNMRQAGYLAAAGIFALDNNIQRLEQDHRKAKELGELLKTLSWVEKVEEIETNILIFKLRNDINENEFMNLLKQKNILISSMGQGKLRMVTHLDYKDVMHTYVLETLSKIEL